MSEEKIYVGAITEAVKNAIRNKTAYGLPDRPSAMGMKADEIKKAFWSPVIDDNDRDCVIKELERVIKEANAAFKLAYVDIGNIKLSAGEYDSATNEFVLKLAGEGEESIRIDATPLLDKITADGDTLERESGENGALIFKLKHDFMVMITKVPETVMSNIAIHKDDKAAHEEAFAVHNSDAGAHADIRGEILTRYNELYGLLSGRSGYFEDNLVATYKTSPPRAMARALLTEIHGRSFVGYQFYDGAATYYRGCDFKDTAPQDYTEIYGNDAIYYDEIRAWAPLNIATAIEKNSGTDILYWYASGPNANLMNNRENTEGVTDLRGATAISFRVKLTKPKDANCMSCEFRFTSSLNGGGQTIVPVFIKPDGDVFLFGNHLYGNLYSNDELEIICTVEFSTNSREFTITYFEPGTSKYRTGLTYYTAVGKSYSNFPTSQALSDNLNNSGLFVAKSDNIGGGIGIKSFATYDGRFFVKEHFLHSKVQFVRANGRYLYIPSAVEELEGYGVGYDDCTNYIDVEHGKFIQRCAHGSTIPTGATEVARTGGDGPTEYLYQLANPVVTDVSEYIGADACLWDIGDNGATFYFSTNQSYPTKSVIIFQIAEEE